MALKIACAGYVREDGKELGLHRPDDFPANHKPANALFWLVYHVSGNAPVKNGKPVLPAEKSKGLWGGGVGWPSKAAFCGSEKH